MSKIFTQLMYESEFCKAYSPRSTCSMTARHTTHQAWCRMRLFWTHIDCSFRWSKLIGHDSHSSWEGNVSMSPASGSTYIISIWSGRAELAAPYSHCTRSDGSRRQIASHVNGICGQLWKRMRNRKSTGRVSFFASLCGWCPRRGGQELKKQHASPLRLPCEQ